MELNIEQIKELIPHRYPFLLVDRITECVPGERAVGLKCVSANEPFFQGHFPEALAQVGAVAILSVPENKGKLALFGAIKNARFKKQVRPGDQLELRCALTAQHGSVGFGSAEALVDGEVACKAELTFALADNDKACEN